uniref:Uncharacterized protein n=1 Tax=Panagrolaimus davidi TaxID=227884 RepID=A0A914RAP8_9BILA
MSKRSSHSNRSSLKEQKTQSGSKRGGGGGSERRSNRSKRSLLASTQQISQRSQTSQNGRTQKTQQTIAPPDEDKFDKLKEEAIKARKTQITQISQTMSKAKRETGYDKTQWELTKWADEAAKPTDITKQTDAPLGLAPPAEAKASEVPGENRQEEGERGDYLLELPLVSLILNGIELLFTFLAFILSTVANGENSMKVFGVYFLAMEA